MAEQTPNFVDLFEKSSPYLEKVLAGTRPDQESNSTPCTEWDVAQLKGHLVESVIGAAMLLSGGQYAPSGGNDAERYAASAKATVEAARKPGVLEAEYETPFGKLSGSFFITGLFVDSLIHGWDLSKGTEQDVPMPADLASACFDSAGGVIDGSRHVGAFGPAVAVPADASPQDRLVAFSGRTP